MRNFKVRGKPVSKISDGQILERIQKQQFKGLRLKHRQTQVYAKMINVQKMFGVWANFD